MPRLAAGDETSLFAASLFVTLAASLLCAFAVIDFMHHRRGRAGRCSSCGYDRRHITARRCPECGHSFGTPIPDARAVVALTLCCRWLGVLALLAAVAAVVVSATFGSDEKPHVIYLWGHWIDLLWQVMWPLASVSTVLLLASVVPWLIRCTSPRAPAEGFEVRSQNAGERAATHGFLRFVLLCLAVTFVLAGAIETRRSGLNRWFTYTTERFDDALAAGTPVVVSIGAKWDLGCVGVYRHMQHPKGSAALRRYGAIGLFADLTGRNTEGNAFRTSLGVLEIPAVAIYDRSGRVTLLRGDGITPSEIEAVIAMALAPAI